MAEKMLPPSPSRIALSEQWFMVCPAEPRADDRPPRHRYAKHSDALREAYRLARSEGREILVVKAKNCASPSHPDLKAKETA